MASHTEQSDVKLVAKTKRTRFT